MSITIGVLRETPADERRVALVPGDVATLLDAKGVGAAVVFEQGCGRASGYPDADYAAKGASARASRADVLAAADVVLFVRPETGLAGPARAGQTFVGMGDALSKPQGQDEFAKSGGSMIALELLPRITRAQAMDVLSSMATLLGYRGVLLGAAALPRVFPLMMTAAGTLQPAKVFVIGVGVAGLSAIATAKRLGAVVTAYDVRSVVKEQVQSLGAKFFEVEVDTKEAEGQGGYAKAVSEETLRKQQAALLKAVSESDVLITAAGVPGKRAPVLVSRAMVEAMRPGTVVVDLMAEQGGNCEATKPGETADVNGVSILGPVGVVSGLGGHASQMYSRNALNFLKLVVKKGALTLDTSDEIVRDVLVSQGGAVVNAKVLEALGRKAAA